MPETKLLFVYATDSGVFNTLKDYVHKLVAPQSYPCALCALTYGPLGEKTEWACSLDRLPVDAEFLHRDELTARFPGVAEPLPAVFRLANGTPVMPAIIGAQEIAACRTATELAALIDLRIRDVAMAA